MSDDSLFVSLDQGGHSSRAIAFDRRGQLVASTQRKVEECRPAPDRVEQDPIAITHSLAESLGELFAKLGADAERVESLGLATQRSSIVCWDARDGRPLSPVLSWQDRRAAGWLEQFAPHAELVRSTTGLFLSPHYGVSKLAWCLQHLSEVREAQGAGHLRMGPLASFLARSLTRDQAEVIDPGNAGRTLLFSLKELDWSAELIALFGLDRSVLPDCVSTLGDQGVIETLVGERPLRVTAGDQSAVLYARGRLEPNRVAINMGTGAFVLRFVGSSETNCDRMLTSVAYSDTDEVRQVVEGTVNGAASALDRVAMELGIADWQIELDAALEEGPGETLYLNGVSGIGSPYWVPSFESRWLGEGSVRERFAAAAESVLFLIQRNLEELGKRSPKLADIVLTGGLSSSSQLAQSLADLGELPVERPRVHEATARGTAFWLAGQPEDWPDTAPCQNYEPRANPALRDRYERWRSALENALS